MDQETSIRIATFNWLSEQKRIYGEVLPRKVLEKGFDYQGTLLKAVGLDFNLSKI